MKKSGRAIAGGDDLVDVQPVANEMVRVIPIVNDNAVVHDAGGRAALNVNLDGSRTSKLLSAQRRDDNMLVVLPIQLVLPSNG